MIAAREALPAILLAALVTCTFGGMADLGSNPQSMTTPFGGIQVVSTVYEFGSYYLYTYQLENPTGSNSAQAVSWFSVAIPGTTNVISIGYDLPAAGSPDKVPTSWHNIGNPPFSVDASFQDPIFAPGVQSAVLYFLSPQGPGQGHASVGAISNTVFSPVPEPATLAMLGLGTLISLRRRK